MFADRLEITLAGDILQGLSQSEFFEGYSVLRNKEIMRIFKDLEMVEYLGSGMPRILNAYPKESFIFTENFIRMVFLASMPFVDQVSPQVSPQVNPQVTRLLESIIGEMTRDTLQALIGLKDRKSFRESYIKPALDTGLIEMTIPDKPNSRLQKYRLTNLGKGTLKKLGLNS